MFFEWFLTCRVSKAGIGAGVEFSSGKPQWPYTEAAEPHLVRVISNSFLFVSTHLRSIFPLRRTLVHLSNLALIHLHTMPLARSPITENGMRPRRMSYFSAKKTKNDQRTKMSLSRGNDIFGTHIPRFGPLPRVWPMLSITSTFARFQPILRTLKILNPS